MSLQKIEKCTLKVLKNHRDSIIPTKGTIDSAGLDLYSYENQILLPGDRKIIDTGICVKIPKNCYGMIWSRSGLSINNGIEVGAGIIDSDYTGTLMVILYNHSNMAFKIVRGMRIAQLVISPFKKVIIKQVDKLVSSSRGSHGFGSTGLY